MKLRTLKPTLRTAPSGPALRTLSGQADGWRTGLTTAQRGYGARWQRLRKWWLLRHPLCTFCEKAGRIELATVLDHIVPHRGDMTLFWDRSNWQGLCAPCHDSTKKLIESGKLPAARIGLDGWPEEPGGACRHGKPTVYP